MLSWSFPEGHFLAMSNIITKCLPGNVRFYWRRRYVEFLESRAISFGGCTDCAGGCSNTACRASRNKRLDKERKKIITQLLPYFQI